MYGRCERDPFDFAVEVCSSCWGEYCQECIRSADRRRPLCIDCALTKAGVRQARITPRGEKKTVKKRRAELHAQAAERSDRYFVPNGSGLQPTNTMREDPAQEPTGFEPPRPPHENRRDDDEIPVEASQSEPMQAPMEPQPQLETSSPTTGLTALARYLKADKGS